MKEKITEVTFFVIIAIIIIYMMYMVLPHWLFGVCVLVALGIVDVAIMLFT